MRRVIVTKENADSFITVSYTHLLESIDRLLHDGDLVVVIGDVGGSSDYILRIDKCKVDEEYDKGRAHTALYGRGRGIFDKFEV